VGEFSLPLDQTVILPDFSVHEVPEYRKEEAFYALFSRLERPCYTDYIFSSADVALDYQFCVVFPLVTISGLMQDFCILSGVSQRF
jgi:hypothetical protein